MVTISPINIGYLNVTISEWYGLPADQLAANLSDRAAILCFHLATANHSVLVDAAAYAFPADFESMLIPDEPRPTLKDQLLTIGIEVNQITDLVITHPMWTTSMDSRPWLMVNTFRCSLKRDIILEPPIGNQKLLDHSGKTP
jgi:hypothetical protein